MKLCSVELAFPYRVPGSAMESPLTEINDDNARWSEKEPLEMRYDAETHSLVFPQAGEGITWSHVVRWKKADLDLVCPDCGQGGFSTGQALGGHRKHCKQKEPK